MLHRHLLCIGVSLLALIWAIAGCETPPTEVFDPRLIQQTERDSASDVPLEILRPLPTTRQGAYTDIGPNGQTQEDDHPYRPATGPSLPEDLSVRMSLQEIIHRAVMNNHDVKVAAYQPAIRQRAISAEARNKRGRIH
jgi:hypothetical protein